jgi:hypothetical protein
MPDGAIVANPGRVLLAEFAPALFAPDEWVPAVTDIDVAIGWPSRGTTHIERYCGCCEGYGYLERHVGRDPASTAFTCDACEGTGREPVFCSGWCNDPATQIITWDGVAAPMCAACAEEYYREND